MSDLSKQNQDLPANQNTEPQESEKVFLERLSENRSFEIALKILAGVGAMVTILTGIAKIFGFIVAYLPLISVLGALVFVVSGLAYYFLSLRPKYNLLKAEIESLQEAKVEPALLENTEDKKALESLETKYQAEIEGLNVKFQQKLDWIKLNHENDIRTRDVLLDEINFLIPITREQKENIDKFVFLHKFFFNSIEEISIPSLVFTFQIFNKSVFDLTLENKIGGHIRFKDQVLLEESRFFEPPETIQRAGFRWFTFECRLKGSEFDFIKGKADKNEITERDFYIRDLVFIVKGTDKFPFIEPQQVRIEPYLKVLNYKDYKKALKPFEDT